MLIKLIYQLIEIICTKASLQEAAATAEEESEVIAETFLAGKMDTDSFLKTYTASRMV